MASIETKGHDLAMAEAILQAHKTYDSMSREELLRWQPFARQRYAAEGPTHSSVACCEVIMELLKKYPA